MIDKKIARLNLAGLLSSNRGSSNGDASNNGGANGDDYDNSQGRQRWPLPQSVAQKPHLQM